MLYYATVLPRGGGTHEAETCYARPGAFEPAPASVAAIVLTLALGIGASEGMFSVLHGVVLRAPPYPDDDRLVLPYVIAPNLSTYRAGFTVTEAEGLARVPGFEALAYYGTRESPYTFRGRDVLRSVPAARVSASFFPLLAVPAFRWLRGQLFEVGPAGYWTLFAAAALLSAAAGLLAALWPAHRAARVAPMQALRCD